MWKKDLYQPTIYNQPVLVQRSCSHIKRIFFHLKGLSSTFITCLWMCMQNSSFNYINWHWTLKTWGEMFMSVCLDEIIWLQDGFIVLLWCSISITMTIIHLHNTMWYYTGWSGISWTYPRVLYWFWRVHVTDWLTAMYYHDTMWYYTGQYWDYLDISQGAPLILKNPSCDCHTFIMPYDITYNMSP